MFFHYYFLRNFKSSRLIYYSFSKQPQSFLSSATAMIPYLLSLQNMTQFYLSTNYEFPELFFRRTSLKHLHFLFFTQKIYYLFKLFKFVYYSLKGIVYYRYLFYYFLNMIQPRSLLTTNFPSSPRLVFFNSIIIFKKKYRRPIELFILNKPLLLQSVKFTFLHITNLRAFFFFFITSKFRFLFSSYTIERFVKSLFFCNFNLLCLLFFFPQQFQIKENTFFTDCGIGFYVSA
jgi:hypothetical protein